MTAPPPYGIAVELEDFDPKELDQTHREICMRPSLAPQDAHAYTPAEVAAVYKWAVGIMARLRIAIDRDLAQHRERHGCDTVQQREQHRAKCGDFYDECIADPVAVVGARLDHPWLGFYVPTDLAEKLAVHVEAAILRILAADARPPAASEPQPKHSSVIPDTRQGIPQGAGNA
jgi:hypothetical protein